MKRALRFAAAVFAALGCGAPARPPAPLVESQPALRVLEVELRNPYRGWVAYARPSDPPAPDAFDVVSVLVGWDALEPREGRYDWSPLERAIDVQGGGDRALSARLYLMPDPYWNLAGIPEWVS